MGSSSSSASGHANRDEYPVAHLQMLRLLDVVLIRSKATVGNVDIDRRVSECILYTSQGLPIRPTRAFPRFDRVGILQVPYGLSARPKKAAPSLLDVFGLGSSKQIYSYDELKVTEAAGEGVVTRSLRQVFATADLVCVRRLELYPTARNRDDGSDDDSDPGLMDDSGSEDELNASPGQMMLANAKAHRDKNERNDQKLLQKIRLHPTLEEDERRRKKCVRAFYRFCGGVVGRPYTASGGKFLRGFEWVAGQLRQQSAESMQREMLAIVNKALRRHRLQRPQNMPLVTSKSPTRHVRGASHNLPDVKLPFPVFMTLLHLVNRHPILRHTLTQEELGELMSAFTSAQCPRFVTSYRGSAAPRRGRRYGQVNLDEEGGALEGVVVDGGGSFIEDEDGEIRRQSWEKRISVNSRDGADDDDLQGLDVPGSPGESKGAPSPLNSTTASRDFHKAGAVSLRRFERTWSDAVQRSIRVRTQPASLLSGMFVAAVLQSVGLLPRHAELYFPACYFDPHFSSQASQAGYPDAGAKKTGFRWRSFVDRYLVDAQLGPLRRLLPPSD